MSHCLTLRFVTRLVITAAHRARSSSRRRGHDEDAPERGSLAYYQQFHSPKSNPTISSSQSSPASVNLPSPAMPVLENVQENSTQSATSFNNFMSPISPVHSSSPSFDYEYPMQSSLCQPSAQWSNAGDARLEMFSASQDSIAFTTSFNPYTSPVDGSFTGYDAGDINNTIPSLSTTPPSSSFATTGLPFRGLEFIRNYNPGGYSTGEQDALWQSFDPGAFGYDPELPFVLGDFSTETQEGPH